MPSTDHTVHKQSGARNFMRSHIANVTVSKRHCSDNSFLIVHVRYIDILTWLRGFQDKVPYLVLFSSYPSLFWELRDKRNFKNLQFWPESLGANLEYRYIERGLLVPLFVFTSALAGKSLRPKFFFTKISKLSPSTHQLVILYGCHEKLTLRCVFSCAICDDDVSMN